MAILKNTIINDNSSLTLPAGTTAQRPASPAAGMIRYNTTINDTEYYDGAAWRPISDSNPEATGGTIVDTDIGGVPYRIHYFTNTGNTNFVVSKGGEVEYLIVAGGGGGGNDHGGGGGAGGLLTGTTTVTSQTYTITVGAGGAGAPAVRNNTTARGLSGQNSSAFGFTANGGGGGGGSSGSTSSNGRNGGSGGGSSGYGSPRTPGTGTAGQGFNGGQGGNNSPDYQGGGGGGASQAGLPGLTNATGTNNSPNGGAGIQSAITGTNIMYAGGGGANSTYTNTGKYGLGGLGGGGRGATNNLSVPAALPAASGTPNTGGGGGGANRHAAGGSRHIASSIGQAGSGGSGIVIIRYPRNSSTTTTPDETRPSNQPYFYARDVRPIMARTGLVLDLDAANPVSYPGTGNTWFNLSGNGLNSSLVNGVDYDIQNYGSLIFDGSIDYVSVPAPSSPIEFGTSLTHEVWIYPTDYANSGGNRQYLIDPRGDGATSGMNAYFLYDYISAPDTVRITVGNSGVEVRTGNFSMPLNRWHHIVATRNNAVWNIYLNGVNIYNATSSSLTPLTLNNSFRIATYANGSSGQYFFEGRMGITRIYNIPLTEIQVKQNFNALRGRYGI